MNIENWNRENLQWLAGYLEGEAAFCIVQYKGRKYHNFSITVSCTDLDLLEKCQRLSGCGTIGGPYIKASNRKPMYSWGVRKEKDVYALCCALFPFMGKRRKEKIKEILIDFKNKPILAPLYPAFNEQKNIHEWSKDIRCKVPYRTLKSRINNYKWPTEEAILIPKIPHNLWWKGHLKQGSDVVE